MALNIGELVAYINVNASKAESALSGFQQRMRDAGSNASQRFQAVGASVTAAGDKISGVGGQLTAGITAPAAGAALAVGGVTAALGWGRLKSVDTAQAQLKGLGYDAEDVERISGQLTTALEGGMLTMGEATSAAASGMASGVEEGKELTRYIQVLDGAVAGSNGTFDEMNQIFARVQGNGQLMTGELQMIEQRMPGFTATMADGFGVSQEKMREMVTNGEVSADDFMNVMEDFAGDMATEYAKSWEGMVQNSKAYVGMIGEQLLGGVFEQSKDSIAEFIEWASSDEVQTWAAETGAAIGSAFSQVLSAVRSVITWFMNLDSTWQKVILAAAGIAVAIGPVLLIIGKIISVVGTLISVTGTIISVVSKLGTVFGAIGKAIGLVSTAFRALSAVMLANPAVLITAAIVALVAALIWFFTQTELGQQIVQQVVDGAIIAWNWLKDATIAAWDAIVGALVAAWDWIVTTSQETWNAFVQGLIVIWEFLRDTAVGVWDAIIGAVVGAWEWIRDSTTAIWDAVVSWVTDNWSTIVDFLALLNPVTAVIRHWDKIKAATSAAWEWVKAKIAALWQGIVSTVTGFGGRVVSAVTGAWGKVRTFTSTAWQAVLSLITGVAGRIRSAVVNMGSRVLSAVLNAWNRAKSTTSSAWSALGSVVSNGVSGVVNFVRGLPGRVLSALGNLGSLLVGSGRSLIDGFTRGIKNAFGNAVNAVKNGVQRVRNFFPFSPAKEGPLSGHGYTSYSGQKMIEDFAGGMSAAESDVVRQAEAITRAAALDVPEVPGMTGTAQHAGASAGQAQPVGGVTNNFTIINPVSEPSSETARKASAYIGVTV